MGMEGKFRVFEKIVLRSVFGLKREDVIGPRKLHSSTNVTSIGVIKLKRIRWADHVACTEAEKCIQNFNWKT
jgi:hypothetical protein